MLAVVTDSQTPGALPPPPPIFTRLLFHDWVAPLVGAQLQQKRGFKVTCLLALFEASFHPSLRLALLGCSGSFLFGSEFSKLDSDCRMAVTVLRLCLLLVLSCPSQAKKTTVSHICLHLR